MSCYSKLAAFFFSPPIQGTLQRKKYSTDVVFLLTNIFLSCLLFPPSGTWSQGWSCAEEEPRVLGVAMGPWSCAPIPAWWHCPKCLRDPACALILQQCKILLRWIKVCKRFCSGQSRSLMPACPFFFLKYREISEVQSDPMKCIASYVSVKT